MGWGAGGITVVDVSSASIMPNAVSGNADAAWVIIGEKEADVIAVDHGAGLEASLPGTRRRRRADASRGCDGADSRSNGDPAGQMLARG